MHGMRERSSCQAYVWRIQIFYVAVIDKRSFQKMKTCANCKTEDILDKAKHCPECGAKLNGEMPATKDDAYQLLKTTAEKVNSIEARFTKVDERKAAREKDEKPKGEKTSERKSILDIF
jgi:hypothetical protein